MNTKIASLAGLVVLVTSVLAGEPVHSPGKPVAAAELVRRLGDASYRVREEASAQLLRFGLAAKPFLLAGMRDPDAEIRRRCQELLPTILHADLQARVDAFIADTTGKKEHNLPGWKRFYKAAGDDVAARALFAEILTSDAGRFVRQCDERPGGAGERFRERAQMLQQKLYGPQQSISIADVAALLLVAGDERVRVPPPAIYLLHSLFYAPTIRGALTAPTPNSPLNRLLIAWMIAQTDPDVIQQVLYMAMQLEVKEGLDIALKVARDRSATGFLRGLALVAIGKFGDKGHLKVFEANLDDSAPVGSFTIGKARGVVQVRDVALAIMVRVTGQSHKDYGFVLARINDLSLSPYSFGFSSDAARQAALEKWRAYARAENKS